MIEETLGEECDYEAVRNIHEKLYEMAEEKKDEPEPLVLSKAEVKHLFGREWRGSREDGRARGAL